MDLPAEFDLGIYRRHNADLSRLNNEELQRHYRAHGATEGRVCSLVTGRDVFFSLLRDAGSILEIGPLASPSVRGPNVKYFDVVGTEALKAKAKASQLNPKNCPDIDYVSPTGDLAVIDAQFDAVVSSHAIEHQPDLIQHLLGVARILQPGGSYFLAVPDKRYCFDHFIAESTIAEVLDAHVRQRRVHDAASLVEHRALTTHNDARRHWSGDHGEPAYKSNPGVFRDALQTVLASGGAYLDSHAWQFSPSSFAEILRILFDIEMSPFRVLRVYPTMHGGIEFYAVLQKVRERVEPLQIALPADFDANLYLQANPDVAAAGTDAKLHYLAFGHREGRKLRP